VIYDAVIPTTGRPSLTALLQSLATCEGRPPERVFIVDDRPVDASGPLLRHWPAPLETRVTVVRSLGRGPAAARNSGWRAATADWIAFLDDDVVVTSTWARDLERDLIAAAGAAGSQGRVRVPLPLDRRPTDWERCVGALETAHWVTADMVYRRHALEAVGGFDERFPRAYREDADLALRLMQAGERLVRGRRTAVHPVLASGSWESLWRQAGNADDVLMDRLHGSGWRERAGAPAGVRDRHLATTTVGMGALLAALGGRHRTAAVLGTVWACATAMFVWERIEPGPRTAREVLRMAATSAAIPGAAAYHWARGRLAVPRLAEPPAAVLFDRDGTLVEDVPDNGDPALVRLRPGAREAVERLRGAGIPVCVVSNQSGIARGRITIEQVDAVNRRVEDLLGPLDVWMVCPHAPDAGCGCRKPRPGLIHGAAARLGLDAARCAVVGDIGSDVAAARAAGARSILVPTAATRREEVRAAPEVALDLPAAVDRLLGPAARAAEERGQVA
jgi:histidinol-phosphate phosphatase family protein